MLHSWPHPYSVEKVEGLELIRENTKKNVLQCSTAEDL
jgi:hypothetical protein